MSCTGNSDCLCGCCSGTSVETPQVETNPPGLSSIAYRAGTWATFKESMLARLSTSDYPALAALKTREDDDFTIAFLDATATVLDILTFYQERLANESYLRTATQLRSLTELSRLIGYQPAPGISASVYLAFTLKAAPGLTPDPSTPAITIPAGSQVQSVPAQGQKPQTFETSAAIQAKADWNALPVQTGQPWIPPGASSVYLSGTSTQLQTGDSLLILGVDRETRLSEQWDVVVLNRVETDAIRNLTYVSWDKRLSHVTGDGTSGSPSNWTSAKVYAFRQKAALFGHNAPNPSLFVNSNAPTTTSLPALINDDTSPWEWFAFQIPSSSRIDLDAAYPKIAVGSWFALVKKSFAEFRFFLRATLGVFGTFQQNAVYEAQLYKVQQANSVSLANFGLSGKVTELAADFTDANIATTFPLQSTEVWAQSEELPVGDQPLNYPLYGRFLDLKDLRPDLVGAKVVALSGNRQKIAVGDGITTLSFDPDDGSASMTLKPGDILTLTGPAPLPLNTDFSVPDWSSFTDPLTLNVEDASGRPGIVKQAMLSNFSLAPAGSSDPVVSEYALVTSVSSVTTPYSHTRILLRSNLVNCYDRNTTSVNANVGLATHGQSVSEILGGGSAFTANQSFTLKQAPLTFIQAPTPTGRQSTLQVQANGMTWTEVPSLYNQPPSATGFCHAQPTGRHRHGAVRRRGGRGDIAHRPEQHSRQLSNRIGLSGERRTGHFDHFDGPAAGSRRRHEPHGRDRRPGSRVDRRLTFQRAANRVDLGTGGLHHGLPELRLHLRRRCQSSRHLDSQRPGPRRLSDGGRRQRVGAASRKPHADESRHVAAQFRQSPHPDHRPIFSGDALRTVGRSAIRPEIRPAHGQGGGASGPDAGLQLRGADLRPGCFGGRDRSRNPGCARGSGGECDGHPYRGDQRRRRPGRPVRRLQRLQSQQLAGTTGHAAAPVFRFPNPHLRLSAGRRNPLRAAAGGDSGFGSRS